MAYTLVDQVKGMKDKVVAGVIMNLARQSPLFQMIPFVTTNAFVTKAWQVESISDLSFRDIGNGYSEVKDTFSELNEGVYFMGGRVDTDRAYSLVGGEHRELDAHAENINRLQPLRWRYTFIDTFINGDRSVDPKRFNGIKKRVEAVGGDQVIPGGGLEVAASSANRHRFLDLLDQAMFEVADGTPDLIITSKKGAWTLARVARREGLFAQTQDAFGRQVDAYRGVPIVWAGTKGDQSTEIITSTESDDGSASTGGDATSFYFVKFGADQYLSGIQLHEPQRIFDSRIDDGVTHRTVFEWPVGLISFHKKSIVRLKGIVPF